jgi:hypothetical protein
MQAANAGSASLKPRRPAAAIGGGPLPAMGGRNDPNLVSIHQIISGDGE